MLQVAPLRRLAHLHCRNDCSHIVGCATFELILTSSGQEVGVTIPTQGQALCCMGRPNHPYSGPGPLLRVMPYCTATTATNKPSRARGEAHKTKCQVVQE